jgi:hypothetical protein
MRKVRAPLIPEELGMADGTFADPDVTTFALFDGLDLRS